MAATPQLNKGVNEKRNNPRRSGSRVPSPTWPLAPIEGDLFYKTDVNTLYVWNGTAWEDIIPSSLSEVSVINSSTDIYLQTDGANRVRVADWGIDVTGAITATGTIYPQGGTIDFPDTILDNKIDLYGGTYLIGVRSGELWMKSGGTKFGFETPPGTWGMRYGNNEVEGNRTGLWVNGDVKATARMYCDDYFRSWGNTGWYNQTHGGTMWMQDSTWIRFDKSIFNSTNTIMTDGKLAVRSSGGSTGIYLYNDTDTNHRIYWDNAHNGPVMCGWTTATLMSIQHDVSCAAGKWGNATQHISNNGAAWRDSAAATHWNNSDPRNKDDILPLTSIQASTLSKVKFIKPIRFRWKDAGNNPEKERFGFDATELPPEATTLMHLEDQPDSIMVDTTALVSMLWQAVIELTEKVEKLELEKK